MPISQLFNSEWLNANSQRKYPLAQDATATDTSGNFVLPNDFLVGLKMIIPIWADPASFTLHSVKSFATGCLITFGYYDGSSVVPVAAASIGRNGHTQYKTYLLAGLGDFYDTSGHVTIGKFENLDNQPPGDWQFNLAGGRLEVDAVHPQIKGLSQTFVKNGSDLSAPIIGDIVFEAGENFRITAVTTPGDNPRIIFSAIKGDGLNEDCVCEGENAQAPCVRTINRIPPSADGNFTLLGTDCSKINPKENGLEIDDICAKPCCGCEELKPVISAQQMIHEAVATIQSLIVSLEARVSQMDQVVLGSRLGDQGCFTQTFKPN
jgi:hypothetical protein